MTRTAVSQAARQISLPPASENEERVKQCSSLAEVLQAIKNTPPLMKRHAE